MAARKKQREQLRSDKPQIPNSKFQSSETENGHRGAWSLGLGTLLFPLLFGLFLGLTILKFGNPVILDAKISAPHDFAEAWGEAWPPHWAFWFLIPLALVGLCLAITGQPRWPGSRWLWILPLGWFGWQLVSATQTVDGILTTLTLLQLGGCVACYFLGAWLLGEPRRFNWLLIGLLAAFVICLVRATEQKLFEFPQGRQMMIDGERAGWTNFAPEVFAQLKMDGMIITTNGVDVANPLLLAKFEKGRVHGTLVYPNALAGVVLLLWPVTFALALTGTRRFRTVTRFAAIVLTLFLGLGSLFWTGSKSGWLIAVAMIAVCLFRLNWSARLKWGALVLLMVVGLTAFGLRFQKYFAAGATSVSARFDYWHAAVQNTREYPLFGSGPGTFQRPYALLKRPESEMARLTHNDYLEQFSDSGVIGGVSYAAWVGLLLWTLLRRVWRNADVIIFALAVGLLGWFLQGVSEFGLYVPALAWTAFALGGSLLKLTGVDPEIAIEQPSSLATKRHKNL